MRRVTLFLSAILFSLSAQASYVEHCALSGVVQNEPQIYRVYYLNNDGVAVERTETHFRYTIKTARPNGRADSGCSHLSGQTLEVVLNDAGAHPRLRPRCRLKLNYTATNDRAHPDTLTEFELPRQ